MFFSGADIACTVMSCSRKEALGSNHQWLVEWAESEITILHTMIVLVKAGPVETTCKASGACHPWSAEGPDL